VVQAAKKSEKNWKNVIIFVTTTHRHKTQHMSCKWSVRVCVPNFTVVRHSV